MSKLPETIVAAFESPSAIGISHAAKLAPLPRVPVTRRRMEDMAQAVAAEQQLRRQSSRVAMAAAQVVAMLAEPKRVAKPAPRRAVIKGDDGRTVISGERANSGGR